MKPEAGTPWRMTPSYDSGAAIKYSLEMPRGWFAKSGVKVGDKVEFR